jgi:hypothetical protein
MRVRRNPMIPLTAVAAGVLAGAVGTVCLDAVHYLKYRRAGGRDTPVAWEFAPVENWEAAPDPGQVAKRVIEGFTQRKLPDRSAWLISTIAHWAYGSAAGAAYGIVAGSLPRPHPRYGLSLGTALFANDYIALPVAGLYKPIWEYDAKTLAWDLGARAVGEVGAEVPGQGRGVVLPDRLVEPGDRQGDVVVGEQRGAEGQAVPGMRPGQRSGHDAVGRARR